MNDAIDHACKRISAETWEELPLGVQKFLIAQFSRRLGGVASTDASPSEVSISDGNQIRAVIEEVGDAFESPATWCHLPQHGSFLEGSAAPDRLSAVLRTFRTDGTGIFDQISNVGFDRGHYARSLQNMIDSRHTAAHAISGGTQPGPADVVGWLGVTFSLARQIESYLSDWV
ncbi:MAG: hypothetical protein AB8G17_09755 [Gammaproteobacteria bacterium]